MSTVTDRIRHLLSQGDLEESLQTATEFLRGRNDDLYDECIQHQGKLSENNRHVRLGIIPQSDVDLTRARVRYALMEVVKIIEKMHPELVAPAAPPPAPQEQERSPLATPAPAAAATMPTTVLVDDAAAADLLQALFSALAERGVETAAQRTTTLLHKSLLLNGSIQPGFKTNNFYPAHQAAPLYLYPVRIVQCKSTNRRSIGSLPDREEGEEFVYTLAKREDTGGMPGLVRLFFSKNGGPPTITNLSL